MRKRGTLPEGDVDGYTPSGMNVPGKIARHIMTQQDIDDVVRGFALLGILLVNILSFGAISAMAFNPSLGFSLPSDIWIWGAVELTAEGAMRALFSMLFGAGVLLFLERGEDRGKLHFKRTFWLLIFGLINGYVLMWLGGFFFYFWGGGGVFFYFWVV